MTAATQGQAALQYEIDRIREARSDTDQAGWLADKIAAQGDYAKEAASMLRRWPQRIDWQKKCLEQGFQYWRAPDAHGVTCTKEQATRLLEDLLGVEVEIEAGAA